jgi:hypothetical protein
MTDPVGYSQRPMFKEGGKNYLWCNFGDIEKLRATKTGPAFDPLRSPCRAIEILTAGTEALIMAAEDRGPLMHAHIGMLRALNAGKPDPNTVPPSKRAKAYRIVR